MFKRKSGFEKEETTEGTEPITEQEEEVPQRWGVAWEDKENTTQQNDLITADVEMKSASANASSIFDII